MRTKIGVKIDILGQSSSASRGWLLVCLGKIAIGVQRQKLFEEHGELAVVPLDVYEHASQIVVYIGHAKGCDDFVFAQGRQVGFSYDTRLEGEGYFVF